MRVIFSATPSHDSWKKKIVIQYINASAKIPHFVKDYNIVLFKTDQYVYKLYGELSIPLKHNNTTLTVLLASNSWPSNLNQDILPVYVPFSEPINTWIDV